MDYTSEEFDIGYLSRYRLFLRIGAKEHALAVIDHRNRLLLLTTFSDDDMSKQVIDILGQPFSDVKITTRNDAYTFIPSEWYDDNHLADYARFVAADDGLEYINVAEIKAIGIKNVHQINRLNGSHLLNHFPQATVFPASHVLLNTVANTLSKRRGASIGVGLNEDTLSIYYFNEGRFMYYNEFKIKELPDFNYYLLSVLDTFKLNGQSITFFLTGDIEEGDDYAACLQKYGDKLDFADTQEITGVVMPEILKSSQHRFVRLLGLNVCE